MIRKIAAIVVAMCGALAPLQYGGAQQPPPPTAEPRPAQQGPGSPGQMPSPEQMQKWKEEAIEKARRIREERKREDDAFWARAIPMVLAPAQPSPWLEAEKRFYADLVALAPAKVIVVPPTMPEGEPGIDLSSRIAIARVLAAKIEEDTGPIPDPGLVYRAFGEARTLSNAKIREQLYRSQAQWLVVGSVRREGTRLQLSFTQIPAHAPGDSEAAPAFKLDNLEIGTAPPELVLVPYMTDAAAALGYKSASTQDRVRKSSPLALPSTFAMKPDAADLGGVWIQQLLGALTVPWEGPARAQERMFERSLAATLALPKETPDRGVLLARALAYLDRRDAAVKTLAGSGTPEAKALAAYLAADLPGLETAVGGIKRPVARLISQIELVRLRYALGAMTDGDLQAAAKKLAGSVPAPWQPLVAVNVLGNGRWTMPPSVSLKPLLDKEFPVAGYTLEDIARGKAALGASGMQDKLEAELLLSPISHAAQWRRANMKEICCRDTRATLREAGSGDVLDLIAANAELMALARLEFLDRVQGLPDRMKRLADLYDEVLFKGGHPGVVQQRMDGSYDLGVKMPQEKNRLWTEAFENSRRVLTWESRQGAPTGNALVVREQTFATYLGTVATRELPPHSVELDVPMRSLFARRATSYSPLSRFDQAVAAMRVACANTVTNFSVCEEYIAQLKSSPRKAEVDAEVAALVAPRFNGSAPRLELLASLEVEKGHQDSARKLLVKATALPYASMSSFKALGRLLQRQGDLAGAGGTYARYLSSKDRGESIVGVSNYASEAGYALARIGAIKEARPLLERAAANDDGSYSSLWSASELALLDGDYARSLEIFRQTYQRYGQPASVRAIASLLFATGERDAAWSALAEVQPQARGAISPQRAVAIGLRVAGADPDALRAWYNQGLEKLRAGNPRFADATYLHFSLLQTMLIDRDPEAYEAMYDAMVEDEYVRIKPADAPYVPKAQRKYGRLDIFGPTAENYRKGYLAFRRGRHAEALEAWGKLVHDFDEISFPPRFADAEGDTFWSGMPYYAISLVKSGRAAEAAKLPDRLTREGRPAGSRKLDVVYKQIPMPAFERAMIAGIVAAYAGDHAKAQAHFRAARGSLAEPGARVISPEYAFVEILELLASDTKQRAYLTMALEFARAFRQYEPWASWAYAFEAAHSTGEDQLKAAVYALKLDRMSMHLKQVDAAVLKRAAEQLAREDPFLARPPVRKRPGPPTT